MYKFKLIVTKLPIDNLRLLFSWDWKIARTFALLSTKTAGSRNDSVERSTLGIRQSVTTSRNLRKKRAGFSGYQRCRVQCHHFWVFLKLDLGFWQLPWFLGILWHLQNFFMKVVQGAYFLCLNYYRYIGLHLKQNNSYRHYNKATIKLN